MLRLVSPWFFSPWSHRIVCFLAFSQKFWVRTLPKWCSDGPASSNSPQTVASAAYQSASNFIRQLQFATFHFFSLFHSMCLHHCNRFGPIFARCVVCVWISTTNFVQICTANLYKSLCLLFYSWPLSRHHPNRLQIAIRPCSSWRPKTPQFAGLISQFNKRSEFSSFEKLWNSRTFKSKLSERRQCEDLDALSLFKSELSHLKLHTWILTFKPSHPNLCIWTRNWIMRLNERMKQSFCRLSFS